MTRNARSLSREYILRLFRRDSGAKKSVTDVLNRSVYVRSASVDSPGGRKLDKRESAPLAHPSLQSSGAEDTQSPD